MSDRNQKLYLSDIIESIEAIESFVVGMDLRTFSGDRKTFAATVRELEIVGEAVRNISDDIKARYTPAQSATLRARWRGPGSTATLRCTSLHHSIFHLQRVECYGDREKQKSPLREIDAKGSGKRNSFFVEQIAEKENLMTF